MWCLLWEGAGNYVIKRVCAQMHLCRIWMLSMHVSVRMSPTLVLFSEQGEMFCLTDRLVESPSPCNSLIHSEAHHPEPWDYLALFGQVTVRHNVLPRIKRAAMPSPILQNTLILCKRVCYLLFKFPFLLMHPSAKTTDHDKVQRSSDLAGIP